MLTAFQPSGCIFSDVSRILELWKFPFGPETHHPSIVLSCEPAFPIKDPSSHAFTIINSWVLGFNGGSGAPNPNGSWFCSTISFEFNNFISSVILFGNWGYLILSHLLRVLSKSVRYIKYCVMYSINYVALAIEC